MNILLVASRLPCPPFKGDQLRVYQHLQMLSARHTVVLLAFYEKNRDLASLDSLAGYCRALYPVKLSRLKSIFNTIKGVFLSPLPFQVLYYQSKAFDKILKKILAENRFNAIHAYLLRMAEHVKDLPGLKILDCIDSYTLNLSRHVDHEKGIKRLFLKEELKRVRRYEQGVGEYFSRLLVCSAIDKPYISKGRQVKVIPNPVLPEDLSGNDERKGRRGRQIIFSGNMDYFPNIHAVTWFVRECFPLILSGIPDAVFIIAGNNPVKQIRRLAVPGRIIVTGFVPSIREYLKGSRVAVAPMRSGSGMQTKILEAMACGLPVVATGIGCGSIKARQGKEIFIADDAGQFAGYVSDLLTDDELAGRTGGNAYNFVIKEHSFNGIACILDDVYRDTAG
jgi:glycosyltransferase involved in cell wall biosynthesis